MKAKILLISLFLGILMGSRGSFGSARPQGEFKLGNEVLLDSGLSKLQDRNIAVITNQTGILSDGTHIIDAMIKRGLNVVKIFTPEHGIRGDENYSDTDPATGIHIVSLYGSKYAPSPDDLNNIDVMVYDIQDVGARFYTYTSTLNYCLQSAAENNKELIVCDRPVIINPDYVDGFILDPAYESFVGKIPAPVCYGMTCGELAMYLKDALMIKDGIVHVFPMQNYTRGTDFHSLTIVWEKPSPNIFTYLNAVLYPCTCFLEGTNVSEGRGTAVPFGYAGAPWCDGKKLADEMNSYNLQGVNFEPAEFTPNVKVSAYNPKYMNEKCQGIFIHVTNDFKFEPVKAGIALLISLKKLFPEFKFNKDNYIDKLAGTNRLRKMVIEGSYLNEIVGSYKKELDNFKELRKKYLIYE
jgi:uncharacterized protein YbbC (DUF1343 family)